MHADTSLPVQAIRTLIEDVQRLNDAGEPAAALQRAYEGFALAAQTGDPALQAGLYDCAQCSALYSGHPDLALQYSYRAIELWRLARDPANESRSLASKAFLLSQLGFVEEAVDQAHTALGMAKASGDVGAQAWARMNLGGVYHKARQHDLSESMCVQAVATAREAGDLRLLAHCLNNLGGAHSDRAQSLCETFPDSARHHFERALLSYLESLEIVRSHGQVPLVCMALANVSASYVSVGDHDAAQEVIDEQLAFARERNDRTNELPALITQGELLIARGRPAEARPVLEQAAQAATALKSHEISIRCERRLAEVCAGLGDAAAALTHHKRYHALYAQTASETAQRRARAVAVHYETEKAKVAAETERLRADILERSNEALSVEAERLSHDATHDALTGLYNRRWLESVLHKAWTRKGASFCLALIDVDHFKRVNDALSHQTGDEVLRQLGSVLNACCRREDVAARYGGEEFAMILRSVDASAAHAACERLRLAVEQHDWNAIHPQLAVTVSIGIAAHDESNTLEALLGLADRRLYAAKAAGRNRIVQQ